MKPRTIAALMAFVGLGVALGLAIQPRRRALETQNCQANLKMIGLGFAQYNRDYDEHTPPHPRWTEKLQPYLEGRLHQLKHKPTFEQLFSCPLDETRYTLNRFYTNIDIKIIESSQTSVVVFDSTSQTPNASDFGASWPRENKHQLAQTWGNNALFDDGHVELMKRKPKFASFVSSTKETQ